MMGIGWKFLSPAPTALYAAAKEGFAWWWRGRSGVLSAWQDDDERGKFLSLGLGVCEVDERVRLLMDYRRLASLRGEVTVSWMGVVNEPIREALITAGYHSTWEDGGYLYEREHAR